MLVPKAFKYSRSTSESAATEKDAHHGTKRSRPSRERMERVADYTSSLTVQQSKEMMVQMPSRPLSIPNRHELPSRPLSETRRRPSDKSRQSSSRHSVRRQDLPPSVAALLAVTSIPPQKRTQVRRTQSVGRRISIDEVVREWKEDVSLRPSLGSHKSMSMLLESVEDDQGSDRAEEDLAVTPSPTLRSTSCDSVPSLDADDRSLQSWSDPATPEAVRTVRSGSFSARKVKARPPPYTQDSSHDHPLIPNDDDDDDYDGSIHTSNSEIPLELERPHQLAARGSSFKSNLTLSLKAIKKRAVLSLQTYLNTPTQDLTQRHENYGPTGGLAFFSDQTLWSHPYLFPRFSPEIRPEIEGTPTISQRRYFNAYATPPPQEILPELNLEEQQRHYRKALHVLQSPIPQDNDEDDDDDLWSPMIMLQPYHKRRASGANKPRRSGPRAPDPNSEAGRALKIAEQLASGVQLVKQREPRENPDFLRVIVLEMNMRRQGKLEDDVAGRARIWLPPRRTSVGGEEPVARMGGKQIPRRWIGVTASED